MIAAWAGVAVTGAAAVRADRKAKKAQSDADTANRGLDRLAAAMEQYVALQRPPAVAWRVIHHKARWYALVNEGTITVTGVRITGPPQALNCVQNFRQGETLRPHQSAEFFLLTAMGLPRPSHLLVECNEAAEQSVGIPPPPS